MAELAAARYLTDADVPDAVKRIWGALGKCDVAIREREAEARKWREAGLEPLAIQADLSADAFRAKRRELQAELRRCP